MSEKTNAVGGLFIGLVKMLVSLGGVILVAVGLFSQDWPLVGVGVALLVLGQVVHALDQRHLDVQLEQWATEAVAGAGPVPPRSVRKHLARVAWKIEGVGGDVQAGFRMACQLWAAEQTTAREEGRPPRPLRI